MLVEEPQIRDSAIFATQLLPRWTVQCTRRFESMHASVNLRWDDRTACLPLPCIALHGHRSAFKIYTTGEATDRMDKRREPCTRQHETCPRRAEAQTARRHAMHPIPSHVLPDARTRHPARRRRQSYYCSRQSTVASPVAQSRGGVAPLNLNHGQSRAGIVRNRRVRTVHALDWIVEAMNGDFAFSFPIGSHDHE